VQEVLDALMRKHMVLEKSGFGSRVPKFQQRFCNTEFSALQFTPQSAPYCASCCCEDRRRRASCAHAPAAWPSSPT